jgi:hypothetical protein
MNHRIIGAGLALALASAAPTHAQTQPPASAPATPPASGTPAAPAPATRYSIDSKFSELFADPNAAQVVRDFFHKRRLAAGKPEQTPEELAQTMELVHDMTPREVAQYPQAGLDDAGLAELDAALAKVPYPAPATTAAPPPPAAAPAAGPQPNA